MKQIIIICICTLWLFSCSHKVQIPPPPYSAQVTFLNKDEAGTITVNSKGFGKDQNSAILNAQSNAFNVILFKGIPGTDLNVPLIENENDAKTKYTEYFNKFFEQGNYQSFLMSSTLTEDPVKSKGSVSCSVDLKINYNSLRKDLEQNNVIRKFGF